MLFFVLRCFNFIFFPGFYFFCNLKVEILPAALNMTKIFKKKCKDAIYSIKAFLLFHFCFYSRTRDSEEIDVVEIVWDEVVQEKETILDLDDPIIMMIGEGKKIKI